MASICRATAAAVCGASHAALTADRRGKAKTARARQLAIYLQHVAIGSTVTTCARLFRRDRATIRHACARIEDARDDAGFDVALSRLETAAEAQNRLISHLIDAFYEGANSMSKQERGPNSSIARLLIALSPSDAWAAPGDIDPARIIVYGKTNGVTAVRMSAPAAAAKAAVAEGLAQWEAAGARKILLLTDLGHARAKLAAPQGEACRARHGALSTRATPSGDASALYNECESPLAWLARRKDREGKRFLSSAEFEAGERFRLDATRAQLLQRVTANWGEPIRRGAGGGGDAGAVIGDVAIDARRRLDRACVAVGPDLAGLLIDVCAYLKGLEAVENERGWPPRSGKVVLKIALGRLAAHYGLGDVARGPAQARARHWGAPDYRPRA